MRIALSASGSWVCAENGGDDAGLVHANRSEVGAWEIFTVEKDNGAIALKTANGRYLCAEGSGGGDVRTNRNEVGAWETFWLVGDLAEGAHVSLRTNDGIHFLAADQGGEHLVHARATQPYTFTVKMVEADTAPGQTLSRLRATKMGFINAENKRVFIAGASAFMHYEKFLRGEDIVPCIHQVREAGGNCLRVFGMAHYIPVNAGRPAFNPKDFGDRFFDAQPEFFGLCAGEGMYVYWSVFPDANIIMPTGDKRAFLEREVDVLRQLNNSFGELTNEQDAHSFNSVDPASVTRPTGVSFCSGSYGDIGGPQPHPWDFVDYHLPRRYPTHIKDACVVDHPNYLMGSGVLLGEPDRYGSDGNTNVDQARLSAGACRETSLGMVFHSTQGRESLLYDDQTMGIAKVFFNALVGSVNT